MATNLDQTRPTTLSRLVANIIDPSKLLTDNFLAVALFSGIGLLIALIAVVYGEQGIWF